MNIFIAGLSSDIGIKLAELWAQEGHLIFGSYRTRREELNAFTPVKILAEDADSRENIWRRWPGVKFDRFVGCFGDLTPVGPMLENMGRWWFESLEVNGIAALDMCSWLKPDKQRYEIVFLVGGGITGTFPDYSAYSLGKVLLTKAVEIINAEEPEVHAVALGTGWVKTKIHQGTLLHGHGDHKELTKQFMEGAHEGTPIPRIKDCIEWCFKQDREVTGGRNITVADPWEHPEFVKQLAEKPWTYKLGRRT